MIEWQDKIPSEQAVTITKGSKTPLLRIAHPKYIRYINGSKVNLMQTPKGIYISATSFEDDKKFLIVGPFDNDDAALVALKLL